MAKLSETDVIVRNDIKRYKKNSKASWLVYLSIAFLILYFLILYANRAGQADAVFVNGEGETIKVFGSSDVYSYMFGVDVILNLVVLLFGFYCGVKVGGYSKSFSYVAYALAALQIGRIFLIPFCYLNMESNLHYTMVESYDFIWLVVMLAASAACFIAGGLFGQTGAMAREKFQKDLDEGTVDLEAALRDEEDTLTRDDSSIDILGDDLDSGKIGADDTSDAALLEAETTSVGGE